MTDTRLTDALAKIAALEAFAADAERLRAEACAKWASAELRIERAIEHLENAVERGDLPPGLAGDIAVAQCILRGAL